MKRTGFVSGRARLASYPINHQPLLPYASPRRSPWWNSTKAGA
ncbi:hypothetical protein [Streptomyces sviceus]